MMTIPEPFERSLSSLTLPGQRDAVEKFLAGSNRTSFDYKGKVVLIEEDGGNFIEGRAALVTLVDEENRYTICVQDRQTHFAQRITNALATTDGQGYGSVIRDTLEAIHGIPPFEIARLGYLILFLIKRGYIPVGYLAMKGFGASGLLYKEGLPYDQRLEVRGLGSIIDNLSKLYYHFQKIKSQPLYPPQKSILLARLKNQQTPQHLRLQFKPEVAQELYKYITNKEGNKGHIIRKMKKVAYT